MKKLILSLAALCCAIPLFSQAAVNYFPESIIGDYFSSRGDDDYKVRVTEESDGTFTAQVIWRKNAVNPATGEKYLDVKNPDKSLRSVPCDQIVIIRGLKYNEENKCWDKGKIYDPTRGIKVSCKAYFEPDMRLCIKATIAGIGERIFWRRIDG